MRRVALIVLLLCGAFPSEAGASPRYAIVMGNNAPQPLGARLWFAVHDAERLARTLGELGQFEADHVTLLRDESAARLRQAFREVAQEIQGHPAEPALLVFYYSGHATPDGLMVSDGLFAYTELRQLITASPARTRVAIVDACDSGSLTRVRGGQAIASIEPVPVDLRSEGVAYVSSTALGEPAQESSALEGGFFSTHLDAALRGAGDGDGDRQVTLTEAFQYAAARTTAATVGTEGGVQHPTYSFQLSGRGDVVLTDLRVAEASLVLPRSSGVGYVVRGAHSYFAEVGAEEHDVRLALPAGAYEIERRYADRIERATVTVARGEMERVSMQTSVPLAWSVLRGESWPLHAQASFWAGPSVVDWSTPAMGALVELSHLSGPVDLRLLARLGSAEVKATAGTYQLLSFAGGAGGYWPLFARPSVLLEVGPELWAGGVSQYAPGNRRHNVMDLAGGAAGLLTFGVWPLRVGGRLAVELHTLPFGPDYRWELRPLVTGGLFVGF